MHVGKHLLLWIQWGLKSIKALFAGLLGFRGGSTKFYIGVLPAFSSSSQV